MRPGARRCGARAKYALRMRLWWRLLACTALLAGAVPGTVQAQVRRLYASGFSSPIAFVQDPVNSAVQYVVEQGGRIRVVQDGSVLGTAPVPNI